MVFFMQNWNFVPLKTSQKNKQKIKITYPPDVRPMVNQHKSENFVRPIRRMSALWGFSIIIKFTKINTSAPLPIRRMSALW